MNTYVNDYKMDEEGYELLELFRVLLKRWWFLCIGILAGVLVAGIYVWEIAEPEYEASAMIYMRGSESTVASLQELQIGAALTDDYEVIFKSRPILQEVVEELNLDITYKELREKVELSNPQDTRILKIAIRGKDPALAAEIVNALVIASMDMVKEIDSKEPYLIEDAVVDMDPVSIAPIKMLVVGGIIGFILSAVSVLIIFLVKDTVNSVEEVEELLELPVLCVVPESKSCNYDEFAKRRRKGKKKV